jgi:hypothetical protein
MVTQQWYRRPYLTKRVADGATAAVAGDKLSNERRTSPVMMYSLCVADPSDPIETFDTPFTPQSFHEVQGHSASVIARKGRSV